MKPLLPALLLSCSLGAQSWVKLGDFPATERDDGVAVAVNNKIYVGSGLKTGWIPCGDFYALDAGTLNWETIASMPPGTERQYACAFAGNNCFYVFGGDAGGPLNDLYQYDIPSNSWKSLTPMPGGGLIGASCFNFGDRIIFVGGKLQGAGPTSDEVWEYRISTNAWTQKGNFPYGGRWRAGSTVLGGQGYLLFGRDANHAYRKELYQYDPDSDSWNEVTSFPHGPGRQYVSLHALNNRLLLFGGYDTSNTYYKDSWYFYGQGSYWERGPDLPAKGRRGDMACVINNRLYYSCGLDENEGRLKETWMLDSPLGMSSVDKTNGFHCYPNPANDWLQLELPDENARIELYTSGGLLLDCHGRLNGMRLDLRELPAGLYFLRIVSERKQEERRFVKTQD